MPPILRAFELATHPRVLMVGIPVAFVVSLFCLWGKSGTFGSAPNELGFCHLGAIQNPDYTDCTV